jgi:low temperature requirement protein LtrA
VFFAIWWAWMNFTWFASSYDTDDVPYRLMTMLQMAGVLILAAGVPSAVDGADYRGVTLGYLVMRVGLIVQWLRAASGDPAGRSTALRYAGGIAAVQVVWLGRLLLAESGSVGPGVLLAVFVGLVVLELAVPVWAERPHPTAWHPHHIAERYSLFAIILLGESVLAATTGFGQAAVSGLSGPLVVVSIAALVLLFAIWWLYTLEPMGDGLAARRHRSYWWGYGHYGIFAALAALGAGLEVAVAQAAHHDAAPVAVAGAVAIPVVVFLVLLRVVHASILPPSVAVSPAALLCGAVVVLPLPLLAQVIGIAWTVLAIAAVVAAVTAVAVMRMARPATR